MTGILYLAGATLKNRILQLRRKPALLIAYIFIIALVVLSLAFSSFDTSEVLMRSDPRWLFLIFAGYVGLFFFVAVFKGLSSGNSFFDMNDVNFLFTGPINPKVILGYGLLNQAGKTVLAGLFILFQGSTFRTFGFGISDLFIFFAGFVISVLLCEILALVIYMYTNQKPAGKNIVRALCILPLLPPLVRFVSTYFSTASFSEAGLSLFSGNALAWFPIVGWSTEAVAALAQGQPTQAALYGGFNLLLGAVLILLIVFGKSDYYEDVLVATETTFAQKRAVAEGNLTTMPAAKKRSVRVREQELWGEGAQALFGKHILESFRENPLKLLDKISLFLVAGSVLVSFLVDSPKVMIGILIGTMYMQTLLIGTGRGLKELYNSFIYLIPSSSFSKIVWSNMEVVLKNLAESVLIFVPAGIITGTDIGMVLVCILVRSLFAMALVSVNLLSMRIFKNVSSSMIMLFLYFGFITIAMAPGIVIAIGAGLMLNLSLGLLLLAVWELGLALLLFYLGHGVLDTCDIQTMQGMQK